MSGAGTSTMRATVIRGFGPPDTALAIQQVAVPAPGPGDLVVAVEAAGVNPIDWKMAAGLLQAIFPLTLPHVPGRDCAGRVVALGAEAAAAGFAVGDRVLAVADPLRWGTHAEHVVLPAANAAPLPEAIDARDAASLPVSGLSALIALTEAASLSSGARVLIPGPQGGVGRVAMALARRAGARVTALIRGDGDPGPALALGVETVVRHITDVPLHSQDIVLDTLGGAMHAPLAACVRPGGVLTCLTAAPIPADFKAPEGITITFPRILPSRARLEALIALLRDGALPDLVERAYPLAGAAQAYDAMKMGGRKGRIVLDMTDRRVRDAGN